MYADVGGKACIYMFCWNCICVLSTGVGVSMTTCGISIAVFGPVGGRLFFCFCVPINGSSTNRHINAFKTYIHLYWNTFGFVFFNSNQET